jgi:hypothetical protein
VAIEEGAYFKGKVDIQRSQAKADGTKPASSASPVATAAAASAGGSSTVAVKSGEIK